MWITKSKYNELLDRLDSFERDLILLKDKSDFGVNKYGFVFAEKYVPVKDVVSQILTHLKLEITYSNPTPENFLLIPIPKHSYVEIQPSCPDS